MEQSFVPPFSVQRNAQLALYYKKKYNVKAGTRVGWTRARQLSKGTSVSQNTIKRMRSFFARHQGNERINPKFKDTPWKDRGYVMHLAWGGDEGRVWANSF